MINLERINEFKNTLSSARSVLIVLPAHPHVDHLGAGLGLYLSLAKNYQVKIIAPTPLSVSHNRLIAVDQVQQRLSGSKQLVVTLPHPADQIERVYTEVDQESGNFKVVVEATDRSPGFDSRTVQLSGAGEQFDLVVLVGARHPEDLDEILDEIQPILEHSKIVKIDTLSHSPHLDGVELVNDQASAVSEVVFEVLKAAQLHIDQDIATNLLAGIEFQTDNLSQPTVGAATFEAVAACLRLGAVRGYTQIQSTETKDFSKEDNQEAEDRRGEEDGVEMEEPPAPEQPPVVPTPQVPPKPVGNQPNPPRKGVPEWLVPKIFSGQK